MPNPVVDEFVDRLTKQLVIENNFRLERGQMPLDVPFLMAPVEQRLEEFPELLAFLADGNYHLTVMTSAPGVSVSVSVFKLGDDEMARYVLEFYAEDSMEGYCECSPDDPGYDPEHECCGIHCDWARPAFAVEKRQELGCKKWQGLQRDYWQYERSFQERLDAIQDLRRKQEEAIIRGQIKQLQRELRELKQRLRKLTEADLQEDSD